MRVEAHLHRQRARAFRETRALRASGLHEAQLAQYAAGGGIIGEIARGERGQAEGVERMGDYRARGLGGESRTPVCAAEIVAEFGGLAGPGRESDDAHHLARGAQGDRPDAFRRDDVIEEVPRVPGRVGMRHPREPPRHLPVARDLHDRVDVPFVRAAQEEAGGGEGVCVRPMDHRRFRGTLNTRPTLGRTRLPSVLAGGRSGSMLALKIIGKGRGWGRLRLKQARPKRHRPIPAW